MGGPRALLSEAGEVVGLFVAATNQDSLEMTADLALSTFCARHGADNAAAALAAFCALALDVAAEDRHQLLSRVRRRVDGDDPPSTLART